MTDAARLAEVSHRLASLFPAPVSVGASLPCSAGTLPLAERNAIARAVPSRQAELAGGRVAARKALAMLDYFDVALPPGVDRAPSGHPAYLDRSPMPQACAWLSPWLI